MEQNIIFSTVDYPEVQYNLTFLPELELFIRKLTESEYNLLKENIRRDGCKEPLKIWDVGHAKILIDGHHRYSICVLLDMDFSFEYLYFDTIEDVKIYMAKQQMGKRNLSLQEISYLRGMQYAFSKQSKGGVYDQEGQTRELLAKEYNVSSATISRDYLLYQALEKIPIEEKDKYLRGESFLRKQEIEFIGKYEVNVSFVLSHLRQGGCLEDLKPHYISNYQTRKTQVHLINKLSKDFENEIKKANYSQKKVYKEKLLKLLELFDE